MKISVAGTEPWLGSVCSKCGTPQRARVQVGEPPDYDSLTAWLCEACLQRALALMRTWRKKNKAKRKARARR